MRTATVIGATAAYASIAASYPAGTTHNNVTEEWGSWTITSLNYSSTSNHQSFDFFVKYAPDDRAIYCGAFRPSASEGGKHGQHHDACDDEDMAFMADFNASTVSLSQKLNHEGVMVQLNGTAPLGQYAGQPLVVPVTAASSQTSGQSATPGPQPPHGIHTPGPESLNKHTKGGGRPTFTA